MELKSKVFTYISLLYWITEAILLLFMGGFGSFPVVASMIILILCGLRLFIKNQSYRVTFELLLFIYSVIFCFMALPASVFIHDTGMKILIYTLAVANLVISIMMLRELKEEIKEQS